MGVAKKGDNAKVLKHNLVIANWNKPDQNSVREVNARINDYFTLCVKQDMAPTLAGLGLAFKVSRFTIQPSICSTIKLMNGTNSNGMYLNSKAEKHGSSNRISPSKTIAGHGVWNGPPHSFCGPASLPS